MLTGLAIPAARQQYRLHAAGCLQEDHDGVECLGIRGQPEDLVVRHRSIVNRRSSL